jgi:hypothetical protein
MIYIQSNNEKTLPHHFDAACAMYGAIETGKEYRLTSYDEVASGKFDSLIKTNLFVGSVEFMREVFKRIGLNDVRVPENSNRESEIITLGEALNRAKLGEKLFIKPVEIKLFTGFVLDQMIYSCIEGLPADTKVLSYEPFGEEILSEWRVYIHRGKIVDSRNYSGDFTESPDYNNKLEKIINKNQEKFPIAYTIDIGILGGNKFGKNVIVEYNDMWAIGNYGMPNDLYLRLLRDRYFEIISTK